MKTVKWKTKFIEYVCCNQIIHIVTHIPLNFSYAGLHCVVIKGYSKSAGYQPGVKFEDNRFRNSWNAVYVAGAWRFVQCNWGARHLVNAKEVPKPGRAKSDSLRYILIYSCLWEIRKKLHKNFEISKNIICTFLYALAFNSITVFNEP